MNTCLSCSKEFDFSIIPYEDLEQVLCSSCYYQISEDMLGSLQ